MQEVVTFRAKVFLWSAEKAAWHFAALPKKLSSELRKRYEGVTNGFGSLKVHVTTGKTTWSTSIFPDTEKGCFVLPLKADVRKIEKLDIGKTASFTIRILT